MRLRARLTAATIVVALPAAAGMLWYDASQRHQAAHDDLARLTLRTMLAGRERQRCEQAPETWGGRPLAPPGREPPPAPERSGRDPGGPPRVSGDRPGEAPPVLHAYDEQLRSRNPAAPAIEGEPAGGLWPGRVVHALVAMPWRTGPCANVLARGTTNPGWRGGLLPRSPVWLIPVALVLVALLVSIGPVVGRLRRLARAVRQSAAAGFTGDVPVEGADEIAEVAAAFQAAAVEVRTQLAARDARERSLREFLASTTHDVMIPLTVLKSHLTTIHEQSAAGALDPVVIASAMNEAHYLGALIHNLAVAAKLDVFDPAAARAPTDLCALVERVLLRHRPIARQLGVELEGAVPEAPLVIDADVTMIEQAVSNLVYNSVRYNRRGGHVGVALDRAGAAFRIQIVDDGPGIPEGDVARLLERGARGDDARTRAQEGQGLGLHIAARVAEAFGLKLDLGRSELGGLAVALTGPLLATPPRPPSE